MDRELIEDEFSLPVELPRDWIPRQATLKINHDKGNNTYYMYLPRSFTEIYAYFPEKLCFYITRRGDKKILWLDEILPTQETVFLSRSRINNYFVVSKVNTSQTPRITIPKRIVNHFPKLREMKKIHLIREYIGGQPLDYVRWNLII